MDNGEGGSRIGGFLRGVLVGAIVCGIGLVALSLWSPVPEGPVAEGEIVGGAEPEADETLSVTVEPEPAEADTGPTPDTEATEPEPEDTDAVERAPAESGQPESDPTAASGADIPAEPQASFPQEASDDATGGTDDADSDVSDAPAAGTGDAELPAAGAAGIGN